MMAAAPPRPAAPRAPSPPLPPAPPQRRAAAQHPPPTHSAPLGALGPSPCATGGERPARQGLVRGARAEAACRRCAPEGVCAGARARRGCSPPRLPLQQQPPGAAAAAAAAAAAPRARPPPLFPPLFPPLSPLIPLHSPLSSLPHPSRSEPVHRAAARRSCGKPWPRRASGWSTSQRSSTRRRRSPSRCGASSTHARSSWPTRAAAPDGDGEERGARPLRRTPTVPLTYGGSS